MKGLVWRSVLPMVQRYSMRCIQASEERARHGLAHLRQEDSQQTHGQPSVLVLLDQLVQIEVEQLKYQAQVVLEHEEVVHSDNVMLIICIPKPIQIL